MLESYMIKLDYGGVAVMSVVAGRSLPDAVFGLHLVDCGQVLQ